MGGSHFADGWSWALLTDLYELTMAHGYWRMGLSERRAVFHLFFRENPFGGGFAVAAGLADACHLLDAFRFADDDVAYLGSLRGADDRALFAAEFLDYLHALRLACDIDAIVEGTVVQPDEPLVRVEGPLLQAQIIESALLNCINFQTLVATKAARIHQAARGRPVLEFGLRRAQGCDGALAASRAAYIGGCSATSNVLAGKILGLPVRGTHAHSWVLCFADEPAAFEAYARSMPGNCIFLVDTFDTHAGVRHAIDAAQRLREHGHQAIGIRLDSGDLAALSRDARRMLDDAGLADMKIVASNDLDEHAIARLFSDGAPIDLLGVGTRLVTAYDQPALGGVYKLAALQDASGRWQYKLKLSEERSKISTPGILQVRRCCRSGRPIGDVIYDQTTGLAEPITGVRPDGGRFPCTPADTRTDLLVPIYRAGQRTYEPPALQVSRQTTIDQLTLFSEWLRTGALAGGYPVGLDHQLSRRKDELVQSLQEGRS